MSVANSDVKMVTKEILKKSYQHLIEGKIHKSDCYCASCLYHFFKLRNKRSRIDKDNFYLTWLAVSMSKIKENSTSKLFEYNKDRDHKWKKILKLYCEVTGQDWRKMQFEEQEHFRIISRYDKKFNISKLINVKEGLAEILAIKISPFLAEVERFLESKNKYSESGYSPPACFLQTRILLKIFEKIKLAIKIVFYLEDLGVGKKIKQRDISRKFHRRIDKLNLLILLDYLEQKSIIEWDKENKIVLLHPDWKGSFEYFINWVFMIDESLNDLASFPLGAAVDAFEQKVSSILSKL